MNSKGNNNRLITIYHKMTSKASIIYVQSHLQMLKILSVNQIKFSKGSFKITSDLKESN